MKLLMSGEWGSNLVEQLAIYIKRRQGVADQIQTVLIELERIDRDIERLMITSPRPDTTKKRSPRPQFGESVNVLQSRAQELDNETHETIKTIMNSWERQRVRKLEASNGTED